MALTAMNGRAGMASLNAPANVPGTFVTFIAQVSMISKRQGSARSPVS